MKRKAILTVFMSLIFAIFSGGMISAATGIDPLTAIGSISVLSFIPSGAGAGSMFAGVYREIWTGEMVKSFVLTGTFLERVPDYSRYAQNDVIHLVDVGAKPDVLINNTTYPLTPQTLADGDIAISLDKFETQPTAISDDELYAINYNKIQAAKDLHKEALIEKTLDKAIHAFAPNSDTATTPIVKTTGDDNGTGYRRLKIEDIIRLKKKFDDAKIPLNGRVLVLSSQHVEDLLLVSEAFKNQYKDIPSGKVLRMFGFDIYEYLNTPMYDDTFTKKAFGSALAATDRISSVAFYAPRMFKARGSIQAYLQDAKTDVLNKRNLLSYNLHFIALPKTMEAIGALVNDTYA